MDRPKLMSKLVKQLRYGRITIPKEFRDALGIKEDDLLRVTLLEGKLEIIPAAGGKSRGSPWARELYELFAPVRERLKDVPEEEIDAAINEAIAAVRAQKP